MKRFSIIAGILTLVLLAGVLVGTSDVVLAEGHRGGHDGKGFWANLTEEQREAVQEKKEEMRSQGATREEIHSAVAEMLKGYGIEVPEDCHGPLGLGHGKVGLKDNLTQEQREAIRNKTKEMRDQGASREEIHSAVTEMLKGYGIELPEKWGKGDGFHPFGPGPGGFWKDLTDEQREAVQEKIKEMRDQGTSREEIHSAVAEMLKGYGIELPEKCRLLGGPGGLRHDRDGFMANLTDEQKEAVHEKIKEMRDQKASREEIRAAVAELLEGFGIESPESSESTSSETARAKLQIQAQSYPNPFNPQAEIAYSLPEDSHVKLTIYNIQGQKVTTLVDEYQSAGTKKVVWDGHDERGESVASGVYLYRIEAGPYNVTNRMVLLK
jgi:uncharacterized membrane-anchored protein